MIHAFGCESGVASPGIPVRAATTGRCGTAMPFGKDEVPDVDSVVTQVDRGNRMTLSDSGIPQVAIDCVHLLEAVTPAAQGIKTMFEGRR